ncbi:elmo ced-12 domain-containing protein [Stylonychia lemnae]|uniref:Elmo ced-12 domain-containing protein n=1 Tax=Stylonychia lemnae TaxID=5949 RepID=A0A077ZMY5_STYLE|nr:elmo ced-12 domain-containing protein [Stylonychia lemnae]|eukprot:CDW71293.1 elmo ced-12 domain-containing protein [Stylonychia lemnae]
MKKGTLDEFVNQSKIDNQLSNRKKSSGQHIEEQQSQYDWSDTDHGRESADGKWSFTDDEKEALIKRKQQIEANYRVTAGLMADPKVLQQKLSNILSNNRDERGFKHSPDQSRRGSLKRSPSKKDSISSGEQFPGFLYKDNRSWAEKLCSCFFKNYDVSKEEQSLTDLFLLVFGEENQRVPHRLESKKWKEIGFQTKNPRLEFRNGGILSLECIRYFIKKNPEVFQQMLQEGAQYFYIALSSINVTNLLVAFLYLNVEPVAGNLMRRRANRQEFKNFCKLNYKYKKTFFELHSYALRFLYMLWCRESQKGPDQYPAFNLIMDETRMLIAKLLQIDHCQDLIELKLQAYNLIEEYIRGRGFK